VSVPLEETCQEQQDEKRFEDNFHDYGRANSIADLRRVKILAKKVLS